MFKHIQVFLSKSYCLGLFFGEVWHNDPPLVLGVKTAVSDTVDWVMSPEEQSV